MCACRNPVPGILLSIWYNVYICHIPKYHYIIVTVVYLVPGILYHSCVCRGSVIIELVSRMIIFTKYLHQVSCLLNACVHLTAVYPVQHVRLS